jgi:dinuclear metal center YbgI/SA1388 family protein
VKASAPTVAAVVAALEAIAPLAAAAEWDNVGTLLEPKRRRDGVAKILLTIDLTEAVAEEALAAEVDLVVAYHPPIFQGLKRLSAKDGKQNALLLLAAAGVTVYSPHTALDAAPGGIADWLLGGMASPEGLQSSAPCGEGDFGRIGEPVRPLTVVQAIRRAKALCGVKHLQIVRPARMPTKLRRIAVAAGAGGSLLRGVEADLWLTGEMSHHDALAAAAAGRVVLLAGHSNTERGYLRVLRARLAKVLSTKSGGGCSIVISKRDRDPMTIV